MSVAAGLAIGFFLYQYFAKNGGVKTTGKLHRSSGDKKLAGVCGGVAEYLNLDPVIVRLAWAVLSLGWGAGVVIYLLLAFILPEE
ncbi:MAG: PspC domain-containing protein [Clostridia bacterium]|nr:PspC domain-containing protein [Clostridia bacterium]